MHPAVALSPPTRCRDPGRRARTDRSPLQLPHRLSSLPLSKPCRTAPLWRCLLSRSPPPDPEPVLEKRAGIPEGRQERATSTEGLRARAGRPPCARGAPSRLPCRPREGVPPLPPFLVGSLSCGGGSQLLHIWLLLHIYILELASERERARGREGGREGGGRRERSGAERGEEEEEERAEYTADIISTTVAEPYRTCFTAGESKTSPVEQQPELQRPQDTVSLPLPPLPHATPDPFTLYRAS